MYLKRNIENKLKTMLIKNYTKPVLLIGERQVGKTTLIKEILKNEKYIYINLFNERNINEIFSEENNLDYETIIEKIENIKLTKITDDIILFIDEIQVNHLAFSSLKTFNEAKRCRVIFSGSNVAPTLFSGSSKAFPVGQYKELNLHPFSFSEFLQATNNEFLNDKIIKGLKIKKIDSNIHIEALKHFDIYLQIGGMPEVIVSYINKEEYKEVQKLLFNNYINDFAKYAKAKDIKYLQKIYEQIPQNLGRSNQQFKSSDIGFQAIQLEDSLTWLELSKMAIFTYKVTGVLNPLESLIHEKRFKLFFNDTGLLTNKMGYSIKKYVKEVNNIYLGEIAENYIASVLRKYLNRVIYFDNGKIEVDFIFYKEGELCALEIKASTNTKSKALKSFIDKYNPSFAYKVSRKELSFSTYNHLPLYAIDFIFENDIKGYFNDI